MRAIDRREFVLGAVAVFAVGACNRTRDLPPTRAVVARTDPPAAPPELDTNTPKFVEDARAWLVAVPAAVVERARVLLPPETHTGLEHGLLALSDVCPKDGLRLEHCDSDAWFTCPSCGSQFDALGDKQGGPSPRGMSLHRISVEDGVVSVDARPRLAGLPHDVRLVDQPPAGSHCL